MPPPPAPLPQMAPYGGRGTLKNEVHIFGGIHHPAPTLGALGGGSKGVVLFVIENEI